MQTQLNGGQQLFVWMIEDGVLCNEPGQRDIICDIVIKIKIIVMYKIVVKKKQC